MRRTRVPGPAQRSAGAVRAPACDLQHDPRRRIARAFRAGAWSLAVLALGVPAPAQRLDAEPARNGRDRDSVPTVFVEGQSSGGSSKSVLQPCGPFITQSGVGAGGASVSEAYSGYPVGVSMQLGVQILADDFVVPFGQVWTPTTVKWLSYQTGSPTTGTFTDMYLNLWNTDPTGQAPGGQFKTGGQVLQSQAWTGVYRVPEGGLLGNTRPIIEVSCVGSWIGSIGAGTYWLDCTAAGTLVSGPWGPPVTVPNQQPGQNPQWNGVASFSANPFSPVTVGLDGQDFLFQIEGANGTVSTFCSS